MEAAEGHPFEERHRSKSATGYKGVYFSLSGYARHKQSQQEATAPTLAPALAPALASAVEVVEEAEGVLLHLSSRSSTSYKGVSKDKDKYKVHVYVAGCGTRYLGSFPTAVEAAVRYALHRFGRKQPAPAEKQRQALQKANARGAVPAGKRQRIAAAEAGKAGTHEDVPTVAAAGAPSALVAAPGQSQMDVAAPALCTRVSLPPATPDCTAPVTTTRPSVELLAAEHVYAKQWAKPAVQWGGVIQWDRSLELAIAAELFQS